MSWCWHVVRLGFAWDGTFSGHLFGNVVGAVTNDGLQRALTFLNARP